MVDTRRGFLALVLVLAVSGCGESIDPKAPGTWHVPAVGLYWEIRADGTYTITQTNGTLMNAGEIKMSAGEWSIHAPNWEDSGNYTITEDTLSITSRLGPSVWQRIRPEERQLALMKLSDFGEAENIQVLDVLSRIASKVEKWSDDAILQQVWYQERDYGNRLTLSFCSPRTERGYQVSVFEDRTGFDEVRPRGWCTDTDREVFAVPRVFLDLPAAIGIARRDADLRGRIRAARLKVWLASKDPILAWVLEGRRWVNVEATTGAIVDGDLTGAQAYIDWYNKTWADTGKNIRRLFRPPAHRSSSGSSWGSGSTDGDGSSGSNEDWYKDYQQSVCESNAYWAGGDAYNRAQSGTTTSRDTQYGCY